MPWDGRVHAWIQDTMVAPAARDRRTRDASCGSRVLTEARAAGCEWLHVDFDDHLRPFYFDACGLTPTNAGLIEPEARSGGPRLRGPALCVSDVIGRHDLEQLGVHRGDPARMSPAR